MCSWVFTKNEKIYIIKMRVKFRYSEKAAKIEKNILLRFDTTE